MTAITLKDRDFNTMTADSGDSVGWTAVVGALSGVAGIVLTIFFRGWSSASVNGRSAGVLEAEIAALALRIAALEADHHRVDDQLRTMATKEDTREIKQQIRDLSTLIYETRGAPRQPASAASLIP